LFIAIALFKSSAGIAEMVPVTLAKVTAAESKPETARCATSAWVYQEPA
jgi:hypothetical protein